MSDGGYATPTNDAEDSPNDAEDSPNDAEDSPTNPPDPSTQAPPTIPLPPTIPPPQLPPTIPPPPASIITTRAQAARRAADDATMAQNDATAAAAQLRATANAAAYKANESWVNNIRAEDGPVLEDRMGNSEEWIAATKRQCLYRNCLEALTTAPTADSPAAVINADRNVALLMKKTISKDLLPYVEQPTAAGTFAAILKLAPNKDLVKRRILAEARALTCNTDIAAYILAHQKAHGRLLTLDPAEIEAESHPSAHMSMLLDGLSANMRTTNSYLLSKWSDRAEATKEDVFKVGEELINNSGKPAKAFFAGSAATDSTSTEGQCPKHRKSNHTWAKCDLNPNTTDPEGRDRRRARRAKNGDSYQAPTAATASDAERLTTMENQLKALTAHITKGSAAATPGGPTPTATALMSELATQLHALNSVNGNDSEYTTAPRTLIDSGASTTFVTDPRQLSHAQQHRATLRTAEGKVSQSTHAGKYQVTTGRLPIFLPALAVPSFRDNLVSVAQLAHGRHVVFTKNGVYLTPIQPLGTGATQIGNKGKDNLYTIINDPSQQSTLLAAPVTAQAQPQRMIHDTMNHSNQQALAQFKKTYPDAAQEITQRLPTQSRHPCVPCVLGKSKRAPFPSNNPPPLSPLDAVSTDTTGPITPTDIDGNRYLQIIVDAASGHTTGWPLKKKSEAADAILKTIRQLQTTLGKTVKRYHADNAGEQHTAELTTSLQKQGTTITTTAPNSSQQNAFAERRFSTIFNATRAALANSGLPMTF